MTMPTAFTVSVLSWSLLAFPDGYSQANATSDTMSTIKWDPSTVVSPVPETQKNSSDAVSSAG